MKEIIIVTMIILETQAFEFLRQLSTMIHLPEVYDGDTEGSIDIFYKTFKKHPMKLPDTVYALQD